jgi:hypothetical protein
MIHLVEILLHLRGECLAGSVVVRMEPCLPPKGLPWEVRFIQCVPPTDNYHQHLVTGQATITYERPATGSEPQSGGAIMGTALVSALQ